MSDFKTIPNFSDYAINTDGVIINRKTNKQSQPHFNFKGYIVHHLKRDDGVNKTLLLHRLLMMVFHPVENMEELTIDHVDGDKCNNSLSNLEWVSARENIARAQEMGKYVGDHRTPIETLNPLTGEIKFYKSISECKNSLNLGRSSIQYRLSQSPSRVFPEGLQYRRASPGTSWVNASATPILDMMKNGIKKHVLLKDVGSEEEHEFDSLTDVCEFLNKSAPFVSKFVKQGWNQPVVPGGYILKFSYDPSPWRKCEYWNELTHLYSTYSPTEVYDKKKKELRRFESLIEASKFYGIKWRAAQYRASTKGRVVFSDQTKWGYFPSISEQLNVPSESNLRVISL